MFSYQEIYDYLKSIHTNYNDKLLINHFASRKNSISLFRIIDKYKLNYTLVDYSEFTCFDDAVRYGSYETFIYLLKKNLKK